jgi:hypothetical protein
MLAFLISMVDDASADQRATISTLYVFLLAATALACRRVMIALGVDAGHTASIDKIVRKHDFRWRAGSRAAG